MKYAIVYNTSNDSIGVDDEGRVCAPQEWRAVTLSDVQDHIANGHLVETDPKSIDHRSNPSAWEAKQEYDRLVATEEESKTDYPESTDESETGDAGRSATKRRK